MPQTYQPVSVQLSENPHYTEPNVWCGFRSIYCLGLFCTAFAQFCISALLLAAGIWCLREASDFCPFYSALWASVFFIVNGVVGMVTAKMDTQHLHVANLVLSLVAIVLAVAGGVIAARNWLVIRLYTDKSGKNTQILDSKGHLCLIGDFGRTYRGGELPFDKCFFQLKLGIAVNGVQVVLSGLLVCFFIVSAILCAKKIVNR
uniref:MARVEL domain-containing protein n=1 Tax=Globodera pallida TaxID=36090 RepID=A0A183BPK0_GLOPA